MALGKESMSGHWCTQCTMQMQCTLTEVQLSEVQMWTIEEYCRLGDVTSYLYHQIKLVLS